jgi:xanthine dehydrogenase YagT iron-sulfur-binding subunit
MDSENISVSMTVNGQVRSIVVEPRMTLLDALREQLDLTGTKKGCDRGECGACTVHVDDRRVLSCMTGSLTSQRPDSLIFSFGENRPSHTVDG